MDTTLNQPNGRRILTDRRNLVDSQLVASLEGEGPALYLPERPYASNQHILGGEGLLVIFMGPLGNIPVR